MSNATAHDGFPGAAAIVFVTLWLLILHLLAFIGGWSRLARSYAATIPPTGETFRFRSAQLGPVGVNYGSCLRFVVGPAGLFVAVQLPFRLAHRPLFVPWADLSAESYRGWFFQYVDFGFAKCPNTRMRVSRRLADELIAASGGAVRVSETERV